MEIKLIAPIYINVDDGDGDSYETDNQLQYFDEIAKTVENCISYDFSEKGIVEYADSELVQKYIKSALVTVRPARNHMLESVCTCVVEGIDRNHKDFEQMLNDLKDEVEGQYSDGWGEGFEQKPIYINNFGDKEEIYVSFWNFNDWQFKVEISA
jgi:hypothetical protein